MRPTLFFADLALNPQVPTTPNSASSKRERYLLCAPLLGLWRGGPPVWADSSGRPLLCVPRARGRSELSREEVWGRLRCR